jgi:hypothetical protein
MSTSKRLRVALSGSALLLVAIFVASTAPAAPGTTELRGGWIRAGAAPGDFDMGTDRSVAHAGKTSGFIKSKVAKPAGFGTLMQMSKAEPFHGKRVRMTAWTKAENVAGWSGLWMRVDGTDKSRPLAFDNMQSRPIKGTSAWTQHQIVLDVAPEATDIGFGILLDGPGGVWLDDVKFEVVDRSVPTTGMDAAGSLGAKPGNLDFEE